MKVRFLDRISILDTTLFVIEPSRIGVCKSLSIDAAASSRKEELISGDFDDLVRKVANSGAPYPPNLLGHMALWVR